MSLSIYQLGIYTAHSVRGESLESIAEKLGKPVISIKKTWYYAKMAMAKLEGKTKRVIVPGSKELRSLRAFAEVQYEISQGMRCPRCHILYPADCTPGVCVARQFDPGRYDAILKLIGAAMAS